MQKIKERFLIVTTVPSSLFFFSGQIQILQREFDVELVSSPGKSLNEISETEKVKAHEINMKREIALFSDALSCLKLIMLFLKRKPKIVHGNTPKGGLLSMFAARIAFVPKRIYCVHGLRYEGDTGLKRKILILMEKMSCNLATHVFAVSYGVKETLKKDGIYKKDVHVIWNGSINGINAEHFSSDKVDDIKHIHGIRETDFVFGFVGRIVKDKGINELIEAFYAINNTHSHTKLLLVGGFEDSLDPISDFSKEQIENNPHIIYVGLQKDVRPFLKAMDVFTFPSYREGFGISIMEAASMGVPAISSNISGCNEIINDGVNGKLIPPKSATHLKEAMELFINNPILKENMSAVTRDMIIDKYEQKKLWEKISVTYTNL